MGDVIPGDCHNEKQKLIMKGFLKHYTQILFSKDTHTSTDFLVFSQVVLSTGTHLSTSLSCLFQSVSLGTISLFWPQLPKLEFLILFCFFNK